MEFYRKYNNIFFTLKNRSVLMDNQIKQAKENVTVEKFRKRIIFNQSDMTVSK